MFERFTERARQSVVLAQEEARGLGHGRIGTEHLLLGVLRVEDGLAAQALAALDVTVEQVRAEVVRRVGEGHEVTGGQMPFEPAAKKVLELSLREALSLGHNYIGTEHVLLGIVRAKEGVGAEILVDLGVDAEIVRAEIVRLLGVPGSEPTAGRMMTYEGRRSPGGRARQAARLATWSIVLGWALGAATLGLGILIGWAIWG